MLKTVRWIVPLVMVLGLAIPASVFADAPTADNKPSESTAEDTLVTITLSGSDTESDPLTFAIASQPTHGQLSNAQAPDCSAPPVCTEAIDYTPDLNYNGSDSFTYTTNDGTLDSAAATVSITITAVNDAPTADDKPSESTAEDTLHTVTMSAGDVDGDALTFAIVSSPSHGTLSNFGTASCSGTPSACTETVDYTPDANYNGSDSFTYKANDGLLDSNTATVSITITAVNDPPTAANKPSETTLEDTLDTITLSGGDVEGSALTFAIVSSPSHGSLSNFGTPSCSGTPSACTETVDYTPSANDNGSDSFTYRTNDGSLSSSTATVSISITAVNDPPSFTKGANQTILADSGAQSIPAWATNISTGPSDESGQTPTFNLTADDNSALFTVEPAIASNGTLTYTPSGTTGIAHLTIDVQDNGGTVNCVSLTCDTSPTQSFTITVNNLVAHNDGATVGEGSPATAINVLANDNPPPNPQVPLTITGFPLLPSHGTVAGTGGTTNAWTGLTYQPAAGFIGTDSFSYAITDGTLTSQATVVITVGKDVTPPSASAPVETFRTGVALGTSSAQVHIAWSATDTGVGIGKYLLQMSTDGGTYATITLPTPTTTAINKSLAVGHRYQFRVRAYDKNGNFSGLKYGPQFLVSRIEDTSSLVKYSANAWHLISNASDSGGAAHYTYVTNATATLTLSGRDFAIVGPKNSFRGSAWIFVDGVFNTSISEKSTSSTTTYRQVLWSIHFATAGTHVIQIKTSSASRFDLDAFIALR